MKKEDIELVDITITKTALKALQRMQKRFHTTNYAETILYAEEITKQPNGRKRMRVLKQLKNLAFKRGYTEALYEVMQLLSDKELENTQKLKEIKKENNRNDPNAETEALELTNKTLEETRDFLNYKIARIWRW